MMQQVKEKAGDLAEQARDQVKGNLSSQKTRTSRSLDRVAHALRQTGQHLSEENEPKFGEVATKAADWMEGFAADLRNRDIDSMFREVESFGRQRPAVFLGGAFVLGFLAARFMKASRDASGSMQPFPANATAGSHSGYGMSAGQSSPAPAIAYSPSPTPAAAAVPSTYAGTPAGDAHPSAAGGMNTTYGTTGMADTADDETDVEASPTTPSARA